ncbi:type 2 lanthipeptide synthetase LanM [Streptomyces sp. NPDC053079]|uniref:type 2 lanthipeptide synthetase LanM n=1 Tax=Streptomyces sp. NPDC053079 TaxID=3365697 RepID=UPI0037D59AF6
MTEQDVMVPAFLPFYRQMARRGAVESALRGPVAAVAAEEHVESLLDDVWQGLVSSVEEHSFRMLIGEFHAFREGLGLPMTQEGDEALQGFTRHLEDEGNCRRIIAEYPVLEQRLETILGNSLDAYTEMFTAYAADATELRTAGLVPEADAALVVKLFLAGSDPHNDNRQVFGLRLADGSRLIYKPRALAADSFVRDLYAAADPYLKHSVRDCIPRSLTVGSHGWQQFVHAKAMESPDQPARYFYRFGALCALFGTIGASDLHDENLLAAGEHPCVIDTETMVRADAGVENDTLPHTLLNHMKLSVVSTMLVPMSNPASPIDVVMAGVGVAGDQSSSMTRTVVRDGATDAISVGRDPLVYQHGDNVPRLGEATLQATEHFADILAGYFDALACVRDDGITPVLSAYPEMPVRCVLRSTMIYGRFLDASTHPDYLTSPEEAERLFRLLARFHDFLSPEGVKFVGDAERSSLATGNVPYFITRGGSTELATLKDSFPGVYKFSPLEFARCGVVINSERTDRYHHFLLEECFGEVVTDDTPEGLSSQSVFGRTALSQARPGEWWSSIAGTIADIGVPFEGPDGPETGWLCGIGPGREAMTITPGNHITFHDNGGIVTFLERAARYDSGLRATHRSADRGLDTLMAEYGEVLTRTPESVFSGSASLLLMRPSAVTRDWLAPVLDRIDERSAAGELETDLVNGPAGLLMGLLSHIEAAGTGAAADLCDEGRLARLRDLALAHIGAPRTHPWSQVAHGELGLRWASARIGRVLGDEGLAKEAADWLIEKSASGEESPAAGWCNGAAGLLLASAEIMTSAGRQEWLAGDRLAALVDKATHLPADRALDLSVCHGSSGVVQSLIAAGRVLGDASLLTRAREYQDLVLRSARANGFFTGTAGRTSLLGYMLGWAGVGDTDVMLHAAGTGRAPAAGELGIPVALTCGTFA